MFIITTWRPARGAVGFGFLQKRWGNLVHRSDACHLVVGHRRIWERRASPHVECDVGTAWTAEHVFCSWVRWLALCMGATQSATPDAGGSVQPGIENGGVLRVLGLFGKLAAAFGVLSLGVLAGALGLQRLSCFCAVFFLTALVLTLSCARPRRAAAAAVLPAASSRRAGPRLIRLPALGGVSSTPAGRSHGRKLPPGASATPHTGVRGTSTHASGIGVAAAGSGSRLPGPYGGPRKGLHVTNSVSSAIHMPIMIPARNVPTTCTAA